jgi:hypothetical protein
MRFPSAVSGVIAALCVGCASQGPANPSGNAAAAATTPSPGQAAAPAATSAVAASAQATQPAQPVASAKQTVVIEGTPEYDAVEKHFLSEGYKLEMHNGEKMFCRREEQLGSRLGGQKVCSTAQQLQETERQAQASVDKNMMQQNNPAGR